MRKRKRGNERKGKEREEKQRKENGGLNRVREGE